jgi:hypothetical protein
MGKEIFASKLLKLFVFLSSLSLVLLVQVSPVYPDSDAKDNEMNMLKEHIEKAKHKYPELNKKAIEIEEKIKTGTPVKDSCKNCHIQERNNK